MSTLKAYRRRHDDDCLVHLHKKGRISSSDLKSLSTAEKKLLVNYRGRDCNCCFYVRGTTDDGRVIEAQSLGVRTFEAAQAEIKKINEPPKPDEAKSVTLVDALADWQVELKASESAPSTVRQYSFAVQSMIDILAAEKTPVTCVAEVEPKHINIVRAAWEEKGHARSTRRNRQTWLTGFFGFCLRMGWVKGLPPTAQVKRVRKSRSQDEREEATMPLDLDGTETNYRKILAAIPEYLAGRIGQHGKGARQRFSPLGSRPAHLVAVSELMYETGLRVSDAVTFELDKMILEDGCASYTTKQRKTGGEVTVFLPLWLAEKLRSLPRLSARFIFIDEVDLRELSQYCTHNVYNYLRAVGEILGIPGVVRPHRFRDSFAVNRLNEGLMLEEVQKLLGHKDLATTQRYYAPFVKSRYDRLKARVLAARGAQAEVAAAKVVPISSKKRRAS